MKPSNKEKTPQELELAWQTAINEPDKELTKTHYKKEYSFSSSERRQLVKVYTIQTLAMQTIDDMLNNNALPRVGIIPTKEVRILYDLTVGKFCVWVPKESKLPTPDAKTTKKEASKTTKEG